ncbi:unnamed protein product, partial [Amoebophrya sp. A120]
RKHGTAAQYSQDGRSSLKQLAAVTTADVLEGLCGSFICLHLVELSTARRSFFLHLQNSLFPRGSHNSCAMQVVVQQQPSPVGSADETATTPGGQSSYTALAFGTAPGTAAT